MTLETRIGRPGRPVLTAVGALAVAVLLGAVTAGAGECPADKMGTNVTSPSIAAAKGVTDTVIGSVDVAQEPAAIKDRLFRLRKLVVQPGGVVPWHSHDNRPAIIYIVSGTITEYASTCAVPLVHKAGDVALETHVLAHWWKNTGKE